MEKNLIEFWKPIKDYEDLYEVSNLGNIRSIDRVILDKNGLKKIIKGKPHKLTITQSGYISVGLYKNSKSKTYRVHRLVAEAFISNPMNLPQVNHIDEDKKNNCVDNLEWCDASYNVYTRSSKRVKKVIQYDKEGNFIRIWNSIKDISEKLNIKYSTIQEAVSGKHFSSNCFWRYYTDDYPMKIDVNIPKFCAGCSIYQYDLQGNFIKEWNKIFDIVRELKCAGSGITKVCKNKEGYTYKNYQWRYKKDILDSSLNIGKARVREGINKVDQYTLDGKFVKTWENASQAGKSLGSRDGNAILKCCKGKGNQSKGFIWKFHNEI